MEYIININLHIKRERDLYAGKEFYLTTMSNAKINPVFGCGWMNEI
jgi:hypothetical protein